MASGSKATVNCNSESQVTEERELVLLFNGSQVRRYPFLSTGQQYIIRSTDIVANISAKCRGSSLELSLSDNIVIEPVQNASSVPVYLEERSFSVSQLQPLLDWRAPMATEEGRHCGTRESSYPRIVSFTGIVTSRRYIEDSKKTAPAVRLLEDLESDNISPEDRLTTIGILRASYKEFESHKICPVYNTHELELQVVDLVSPDVITVFCNLKSIPQPTWLVPMTRVTFNKFLLTKSLQYDNVYCTHSPMSTMMPASLPGAEEVASSLHLRSNVPVVYISQLFQDVLTLRAHQSCIELRGNILSTLHLSLKFQCDSCNQVVVNGQCREGCPSAKKTVREDAKFLFFDGSGECVVCCHGDVVNSVLGISNQVWTGFKDSSKNVGQLIYAMHTQALTQVSTLTEIYDISTPDLSKRNTLLSDFAKQVSCSDVHRALRVVGQPFVPATELVQKGLPRTRQLSVSGGRSLSLLSIPRLHVRLLHAESINYIKEAALLMEESNLSSSSR